MEQSQVLMSFVLGVLLTRTLQRRLDVNCTRDGWSPINYCTRHGCNAWVSLLIDQHTTDVNATQQKGPQPLLTAA